MGGSALYVTIREDGPIATVPVSVAFDVAAPGTEASHQAMASISKMEILRGQDVLVNGATGRLAQPQSSL